MARIDRTLLLGLGCAGAVIAGLALLVAMPRSPAPVPRTTVSSGPDATAEAVARQERELDHLRNMRQQYLWGIDNLRANQAFVRYQLIQLREARKRTPADDPDLARLEARLIDLPELARDYAENEERVRRLLAELETELAAREAALSGVP